MGAAIIVRQEEISGSVSGAILALVFEAGARPDADAVSRLSEASGSTSTFTISHVPRDGGNWLELLASGLTYDCHGLAPGDPAPFPPDGALLGLAEVPTGETLTLEPSPHLAEGRGMLPVVRIMVGIGAQLAALPGVLAAHWIPARCWMTPKYFAGVATDWLAGGAFPALGFTSLQRERDGTLVSAGLDYLIGQELRFEADRRLMPASMARIAMRITDELVQTGPLQSAAEFAGPEGERVLVEPDRSGRLLRISMLR